MFAQRLPSIIIELSILGCPASGSGGLQKADRRCHSGQIARKPSPGMPQDRLGSHEQHHQALQDTSPSNALRRILAESCLCTRSKFSASQTYVSRDMKKRWKPARDKHNYRIFARAIRQKMLHGASSSLWVKLSKSDWSKTAQWYTNFSSYRMEWYFLRFGRTQIEGFDPPNKRPDTIDHWKMEFTTIRSRKYLEFLPQSVGFWRRILKMMDSLDLGGARGRVKFHFLR